MDAVVAVGDGSIVGVTSGEGVCVGVVVAVLVGLIVGVGGPRVLAMTVDPEDAKGSLLYGVDVKSGEVAFRKKIPYPLGVRIGSNQKERFDYRLGPEGKVWTFIGGALVRIDPKDASIDVVGKVKGGGRIAFSGPCIYLSGSTELRRVRP